MQIMIRALSHHHEEEDNNMGDITVSTAEAEVLKRQHIKHEMLDYKFYLSKQEWLEEKIARLDYKLSGAVSAAPFGGGIGSVSSIKDSWITVALAEQEELLEEKKNYDKRVNDVESWLGMLDEELYNIVHLYVIVNGCSDVEKCVDELGLTNSKKLLRAVERALSIICEKI